MPLFELLKSSLLGREIRIAKSEIKQILEEAEKKITLMRNYAIEWKLRTGQL